MHTTTRARTRHRWLALAGLLALAAPWAWAGSATDAAAVAQAGSEPVPGIGLVLGGGGARGAAHIGVLKVLERERIPVSHLSGTSMGSIVGGLYAAGYAPDEIEAVLTAIDWREMFRDDAARAHKPMRRKEEDLRYLLGFKLGLRDGRIQLPRGVVQGQKLLLLLRRLLLPAWQVEHFDQLAIPFRCVGTDIGRGEAVVFEDGDLALAIRASMSVPAAFAPLKVGGRLMVDGGLMDNVPIDVVRRMGAQRVVAVDVGEPLLPESELNSPVAITLQMITVLMANRTRESLATLGGDDVLIRPALGDIASTDFERAVDTIALGEAAAEAMLPQLRRFAVPAADYARWQAQHRRRAFDAPLVEFLEVARSRSRTAGYVESQLEGLAGAPLDPAAVEDGITAAFGYGAYERISWQLVERDGRTGIEVLPVDKGWGPNYLTFGLQLSDDFDGGSSYLLQGEFTMTGLNRLGGEWRSAVSLGQEAGLRTEFYQPWGRVGQFAVLPWAEHMTHDQPLRAGNARVAEYRVARAASGVDLLWNPSNRWQVALGLERGHELAKPRLAAPGFPARLEFDYGLARLAVIRDTLDSVVFPLRGSRTELALSSYSTALGSPQAGETFEWAWDRAATRGATTLLLGARGMVSDGDLDGFRSTGFLGGFTNLSGYAERDLFGRQSALLRAVGYRRLDDMSAVFSVQTVLGASLEAGNVWDRQGDMDLDDLILAGSVFIGAQTPFGPVFLGYGHAETGASMWYLNFGSLLRPRL